MIFITTPSCFFEFLRIKNWILNNYLYLCSNKSHHASQRCVPRWDFAFYMSICITTYWSLLLVDSKQRLEDRLEDISFPSLSTSLYVADNERRTGDADRYGIFFRLQMHIRQLCYISLIPQYLPDCFFADNRFNFHTLAFYNWQNVRSGRT